MKKMFVLLLSIVLLFSCTQAQKEVVKAKLFDITGSPAIGDYTYDVGIIASADMKTLNVDYTGLNIDDEITRIGNIAITTYYYPSSSSVYNSYLENMYYDPVSDSMEYWFSANKDMATLPQYNAHANISLPDNFFKFSTPLVGEAGATGSLKITGTALNLRYTPDSMKPEIFTEFIFKAKNNGYGPLTLVGYMVMTNKGYGESYGDTLTSNPG